MQRRANGEGSIRQLKSGFWEARIMYGTHSDGRPKIKTFTAKKRSIVAKKLADFIASEKADVRRRSSRETVMEWVETWLEEYVARQLKTSTRISYENIVRNQIIPRLGQRKLAMLSKSDIEEFYKSLLKNGRADGKGGLSIKTIRNVHIVLHRALREAVMREYIDKNPASAVNIPTRRNTGGSHRTIEVLTLEEQRALTALCGNDVYGTAVATALSTGLRMGELLGLRWSDIDFAARTISISRQLSRLKDYTPGATAKTRLILELGTKTNASTRVIPMAQNLCSRLLDYRSAPPESYHRGRRPLRDESSPPDMVFTGRDGGFLDPANFRYHYQRLLNQAGARRLTVHALRHTFATRALEAGVPVKAVSQILGHAGSRITMDIYSHVLPAFQAEAMNRIADYIAGGTDTVLPYNTPYNSTRVGLV